MNQHPNVELHQHIFGTWQIARQADDAVESRYEAAFADALLAIAAYAPECLRDDLLVRVENATFAWLHGVALQAASGAIVRYGYPLRPTND